MLSCIELLFDAVVIERSTDLDFDPTFDSPKRKHVWAAFVNWWARLLNLVALSPSILTLISSTVHLR
jgi:hypothetical protein